MSVDQLPPGRASAPHRGAQLVRYDEYIDKQIEATRRMVKTVDVMTALLVMAAGTLGFLLTAAIVEHWLVPGGFNLGVRLLLFVALIGGLLTFAARRLWPLVAGSINPAYAAQTIERDNPSLKNSLLNLLLFRQHRDDVTDAVYETLEEQAAKRLTRVPIDSAVDRTQLLRLGYVLVAIVAAVALYKIFSPKDPFITAERVLMPWARIVAPSRVSIENVEPGAVTLARGEVLTISADIRGIGEDDPVVIKYTTADGQAVDRPAPMTPTSGGLRFTGQLPPASDGTKAGVAQNLRYRIEAGDARSLEYAVTVVAAPTITVEKIDYDYPAYTLYVDRSVDRLGDIRAIEGTRVTIHARANGPIEEAEIDFEADGRRDVRLEATGSDARATFTLELREDRRTPQHTSYVLRFTGSDGRPNRDPAKFPIDVTPDRAPEVSITAPAEKTRDVRLDETVAIEVDAIDSDFALADVRLHGESAGKPVLDEKLLAKEHTGRFRGRLLFTPIEHNLKPGDVVRYWVAARDNRTPAANEVASDSQSLRIIGGQPGQQQQKQNGQRDERDQQQNNDQSEKGEQQEGAGGQSGGQGADSSEGSELGKPNPGDASQSESAPGESAQGESASADGNSDQQGEQSPENQSSESTNGESGANENSASDQSTGQRQSPSAGQNQSGNQQQQPGESSESGADGDHSEQNQSPQPGGNNSGGDQNAANQPENQPGADNQPGQQRGEPRGSESKPVSSEGDNDGEAFDRIREFMNREGQLPKEGEEESSDNQSEQGESNSGESRSGESNSGESALADGKDAPKSEGAKPNQSSDASKGPEQKPDANSDGDSQPGESTEKSGDESQKPGDKQSPEGQHTSSEGESGAGEKPKEGQGSPESEQPGEQPDQWQQKPSGDKQGDEQGEQEAPSGGQGDRKNDSQGNEGGDRSGGGEEGAGQKSERDGTGSSGQNQSADEGAGESSEQGAGENSPDAGKDAKSSDPTGQSGTNEKGDGSSQSEGQGEQPGSAQKQPGEPASGSRDTVGGNKPANSNTDTKNEPGKNESEAPESPEAPAGEQQNPGNEPGASNSADGAGRVPDGVIQPSNSSGTAPDADAANLDYAKKQTDLVLETLDEQMKRQKVDKRLLDKLGWTEADLKRFLDRWRQLKDAAARDDSPVAEEAKRELDDALRSLGLRRGELQQGKVSDDQSRDLREGYRGAIPLKYQERLRAYNQGVSRAEQADE